MSAATEPSTRTVWKRAAGLATLAFLVFAGSTPGGFVFDDRGAIETNPVVTGHAPISDVLRGDFWGTHPAVMGMFRPVVSLWFRFDWAIGGGSPFLFHLTNVFLHALVVVLAYLVGRRLIGERPALFGAIFVATFAASGEAVQGLVGRADLLLGASALIGLWAFRSERAGAIVLTWLAFAIALGSKESAIVVPIAWLLVEWWRPSSRRLPTQIARLLPLALIVVGYVLLRSKAVGDSFRPKADPLLSPLGVADPVGRIFGAGQVFLRHYLRGMIDPFDRVYLCTVPECAPSSPSDPGAWIGLLAFVALVIGTLIALRKHSAIGLGLAWFVLFFAPISNFLTGSTTSYAERLLYVPVIGLGWALGALVVRWGEQRIVYIIAGMLVALNAGAIQLRNLDWRSTDSLFLSGLDALPDDAAVHANAAHVFFTHGKMSEAAQHAGRALELWPDSVSAASILGGALDAQNQPAEAEAVYQRTLKGPGRENAGFMTEYARFLAHRGRLDEARVMIRDVVAKYPNDSEAKDLARRIDLAIEARAKKSPAP